MLFPFRLKVVVAKTCQTCKFIIAILSFGFSAVVEALTYQVTYLTSTHRIFVLFSSQNYLLPSLSLKALLAIDTCLFILVRRSVCDRSLESLLSTKGNLISG